MRREKALLRHRSPDGSLALDRYRPVEGLVQRVGFPHPELERPLRVAAGAGGLFITSAGPGPRFFFLGWEALESSTGWEAAPLIRVE